jgi:hypothetical protein
MAREFDCFDCGQDTGEYGLNEYYAVHNHVWALTGLGPEDGLLCVGCLERRIGRQLSGGDFPDVFINRWGSLRLESRMHA